MALTKIEAAKLTQDLMLRGVIETIITESEILKYLPFMELTGTALTYNRENAAASAAFYAAGDTWVENVGTHTQVTAGLAILGGDADVDSFLQRTYSNPNDLEATVIARKAKAVAYAFNNTFINGDTGADANAFNGIDVLCGAGQTVSMGAAGGTLTLARLDEMIDAVKPGKPDLLIMSRRSRRKLKALRVANGAVLESDTDAFGARVSFYDGVPIAIDDNISDAQTVGASTDCSSIYACKFGDLSGLMGLENGGIQVERVGSLETKDAVRTRVKWYCGLALFSTLAVAKLAGVRD